MPPYVHEWNVVCSRNRHLPIALQTRSKPILATALFGLAWVGVLSLGLGALLKYESAPGTIGSAPQTWPVGSGIERAKSGGTLVMLAHPHCPCTRASMGELAKIMAEIQGKVSAYVLFLKPPNSGADWDDTDLRRSAAQIPGVTVVSDLNGDEARRFGAETSGHTLLFDSAGRLLFSGGITSSRGHAGGNAGESAIVALANNQASDRARTFVFGCALTERARKGESLSCPK
jgi:hypothetical protein